MKMNCKCGVEAVTMVIAHGKNQHLCYDCMCQQMQQDMSLMYGQVIKYQDSDTGRIVERMSA